MIRMHKDEVICIIGKKRWKAFVRFMGGQTVSAYPDGSIDYYGCDVRNFMEKPNRRFFD